MVLSVIAFTFPVVNFPLFIAIAVIASTSGRFVLMKSSRYIVNNRFVSSKYRTNMDNIRRHLEKKKSLASLAFLIEAFTPLPSDQFFIAYGLTGMKARYALVPFVIGRIFTYSFWVYTATEISKRVATDSLFQFSFLSGWFIIVELALVFLVYMFIRIDWEHLILHHRLRIVH